MTQRENTNNSDDGTSEKLRVRPSENDSNQSFDQLEKENLRLKAEAERNTKQLQIRDQQIRDINREFDEMVYTISHDLKSPLSNIQGLLLALFEESNQISNEAEFVKNLLQLSIDNLQKILIDLSEIAHIQKHDDKGLLDIKEVFEDVKFSMHDEILKYSAHVEADFSLASTLYFSRQNLKNIFYHLLTNALKFSSPNRIPIIEISAGIEPDYLVLSIKDNGMGIKEKDMTKIFSLFKRGYTHVAGSGIGLFMVKRILDKNMGRVEVESVFNEGSTFRVYLKNHG